MTSFKELQKKLAEYTSGLLPLDEFRTWFAPVLRDVHKSSDADVEKLAHAVEWEFCDLARGSSEQTMKENLARLASVALGNPLSRALRNRYGNPYPCGKQIPRFTLSRCNF